MAQKLRVIILKPSKYGIDGYVDRFRKGFMPGFMPNATVPLIRSLTPDTLENRSIEIHCMAYRTFYSSKHFMKYVRRHFEFNLASVYYSMYPVFNRLCSWQDVVQ